MDSLDYPMKGMKESCKTEIYKDHDVNGTQLFRGLRNIVNRTNAPKR